MQEGVTSTTISYRVASGGQLTVGNNNTSVWTNVMLIGIGIALLWMPLSATFTVKRAVGAEVKVDKVLDIRLGNFFTDLIKALFGRSDS